MNCWELLKNGEDLPISGRPLTSRKLYRAPLLAGCTALLKTIHVHILHQDRACVGKTSEAQTPAIHERTNGLPVPENRVVNCQGRFSQALFQRESVDQHPNRQGAVWAKTAAHIPSHF